MSKLSPEILEKIKDSVNIIEVIGEHVVLRKSGANFSGLCPFHAERTPSFSVSESKQVYHCYGCKKGGDIVSFLMEIHGMSFMEAVAELADRAKLALPKDLAIARAGEDPVQQKRRAEHLEKVATGYKLNRFVAHFYHQKLMTHAQAMQLTRARGLTDEIIQSFYLGYAPQEWSELTQYLESKKAPVDMARELGLIRPSTQNTIDFFRNRIIFPIINTRGKVAGFGGRYIGEDPAQPKYLNSSDSPLFQKSKVLYGLYQAQKYIRSEDSVIVVEGYFDVLAMHAAGFQNVVATCGTALTPDHLQILRKFAQKVIVMFDDDSAGIMATDKAMELGLSQGQVLYGIELPTEFAGKDPDEILLDPQGKEVMQEVIAKARPLIDRRMDEEIHRSGAGAEEKTQAIKAIQHWLSIFQDRIGMEIRLKDAANRLRVPESLFGITTSSSRNAGNRPSGGAPHHSPNSPMGAPLRRSAPAGDNTRVPPTSHEIRLLNQILSRGIAVLPLFREIAPRLPEGAGFGELFDHPGIRGFLNDVFQDVDSFRHFLSAPAQYLDSQNDPGIQSALRESLLSLSDEGQPTENSESSSEAGAVGLDELRPILLLRVNRAWARISQRLQSELASAEARKDAHLQAKLMQEYLDVQRKMKELGTFYDEV